MKHSKLALSLLLSGLLFQYSWQMVDPEYEAWVWNIASSAFRLGLILLIAILVATPETIVVCGLLAIFEMMVIGCSVAYLYMPWKILPGEELCSARLNIPTGIAGAVIALVLIQRLVRTK